MKISHVRDSGSSMHFFFIYLLNIGKRMWDTKLCPHIGSHNLPWCILILFRNWESGSCWRDWRCGVNRKKDEAIFRNVTGVGRLHGLRWCPPGPHYGDILWCLHNGTKVPQRVICLAWRVGRSAMARHHRQSLPRVAMATGGSREITTSDRTPHRRQDAACVRVVAHETQDEGKKVWLVSGDLLKSSHFFSAVA